MYLKLMTMEIYCIAVHKLQGCPMMHAVYGLKPYWIRRIRIISHSLAHHIWRYTLTYYLLY